MALINVSNFLLFLLALHFRPSQENRELRLLGMLPVSGTSGWNGGAACIPAINMALEDIHNYPTLLDGYNLTYKWLDTQCNPGLAVYQMFEALQNDPTYHMLLGAGCSTESESTSSVSYLWNLTQLSYGSSSPILSDRQRFPKFFRLAGPDQKLNAARIAVMQEFNWKKVATINQAFEFFSMVIDDFVNNVVGTDITIISQEIFVHDPMTRVQNLKKRDARIIVTAMYEDKARETLCAAYKVGLYGPKIVWMFVAWFSKDFWLQNLDSLDCSAAELSAVVEGSFVFGFFYRNPLNERGIAGMTPVEFYERYHSHPLYDESLYTVDFIAPRSYDHIWIAALVFNCTASYLAQTAQEFDDRYHSDPLYDVSFKPWEFTAGLSYDHIWIAALAFNCTAEELERIGHPKTLDEFDYSDSDINEVIFSCMKQIDMTGISGKIAFGEGADPSLITQIQRIQDGVRQYVGIYRPDLDPPVIEWKPNALVWKGGNIPRDSTYVVTEEVLIPSYLYITMATAAATGIVAAVLLFIFNIYHRNNKVVKMSSPNINNVLLLGCVISYCTIFMKVTASPDSEMCKAQVFFFSIGFTTVFGSLFSKTWRVYRIFTNKKLLRRTIKDYQLLAIIGAMVSVVLAVLIVWEIISPQRMVIRFLEKEVYMIGNDAEVRPFVRICESDYSAYFSWILYVIEGALLAFGAFLAWETRKVKIEALNDSHQIGLCLYNVVLLSAVGLTLSLLLDEQNVLLYGIKSGCILIGTTLTQLLIFIPKVLSVYQNNAVGSIPGTMTQSSSKVMTAASTLAGTTTSMENQLQDI